MIPPYNFRRLEKRWQNLLSSSADLLDLIPEYYLREYGQDAMRMYVLFSGRLPGRSGRDEELADGILHYLRRYWRIAGAILERSDQAVVPGGRDAAENPGPVRHTGNVICAAVPETGPDASDAAERTGEARQLIYTVNDRIRRSMWNTAAAAMMEGLDPLRKAGKGRRQMNLAEARLYMRDYILLSAPFTPCIAQELWIRFGVYKTGVSDGFGYTDTDAAAENLENENVGNIMDAVWPTVIDSDRIGDPIRLPVCVDGRRRTEIAAFYGWTREKAAAESAAALGSRMPACVRRVVYVPGRILNFVTADKA